MSNQDHTEQHSDQPAQRRKSNRASKSKQDAKPTESQVETKAKDGRHLRQLPSGAIALI